MAIDYSTQVYEPGYLQFSRPVVFTPVKSQPNVSSFEGRGIFSTMPIDIISQDGSVVSDQKTILDILEKEFSILPIQGDRLSIPAAGALPDMGDFEVQDVDTNGGGESTLTLRRRLTSVP
jgi:hypothetical protein